MRPSHLAAALSNAKLRLTQTASSRIAAEIEGRQSESQSAISSSLIPRRARIKDSAVLSRSERQSTGSVPLATINSPFCGAPCRSSTLSQEIARRDDESIFSLIGTTLVGQQVVQPTRATLAANRQKPSRLYSPPRAWPKGRRARMNLPYPLLGVEACTHVVSFVCRPSEAPLRIRCEVPTQPLPRGLCGRGGHRGQS